MSEVTIAIPTFRRPKGLARLLASLADLRTDANVTVLIGDNDMDEHRGYDLCGALRRSGYRWPLEAIVVAERGIAQNRDALVTHALQQSAMQFLVMLDDDEWVEPHWLDALLRTQAAYRADAVEGPVIGVIEGRGPVQGYNGVASHRGASGPVKALTGAGNLLLTRACLEKLTPPYFDSAFALTGGEDKDFFLRLERDGARFAWSAEALSYTAVPPSRAGLKWALMRAYRVGNSDMRVFLKHRSGIAALVLEFLKIAGALLLSPLVALILAASPNRRMAALRKLCRAAGKTAALLGYRYREYSVIHGE